MSPIKLVLDGDPADGASPFENGMAITSEQLLAQVESMTAEEELQISQFSRKIDLRKTEVAANYGVTVQKQSAAIASKTLDGVKSMRTEEIGGLLVRLVASIDSLEDGNDKGGVLSGFFRKFSVSAEDMNIRKENAEITIDMIERQLEGHKLTLRKDIILLNELYEENWQLYKALTMYIKAAELALERARTIELAALSQRAQITGRAEDSMFADIFSGNCDQFEKQLDQLILTRTICLQSAPQILMLKRSDEDLLIKLQSSIVNTIPLWKKKAAMSAAMNNNLKAARAVATLDGLTNNMLKDQASQLRMSLAESVKQVQRDPVEASTVEFVNREIIGAVMDYMDAEQKGAQNRHIAADAVSRSQQELVHEIKF